MAKRPEEKGGGLRGRKGSKGMTTRGKGGGEQKRRV